MEYARQLARLYGQCDRPVVLVGPVGSGKTSLAESVHRSSGRSGRLVAVSSGELTETLYADALFGHVAGAFTGAKDARLGAFREAADGTLLLDDLALMAPPVQAALLRAIESRAVRPLGASEDVAVSARLLFATTGAPQLLMAEGKLLPDLCSRLGELIIRIPPLSEREDEIPAMAIGIGNDFAHACGWATEVRFTPAAMDLLRGYAWPLNVRELVGVVERAVLHAGVQDGYTTVRPVHLPLKVHEGGDGVASTVLTPGLVAHVLREVGGNQSEAARRLGVHRNTIGRYLRNAR